MFNQSRLILEDVSPQINGGLFPVKRVIDEIVPIKATVLCDGHDVLQAGVYISTRVKKSGLR
jgi:starch synthase (maltosyl-transferring)